MNKQNLRHYAHGDQQEGNAGLYFCAGCDTFSDKAHFDNKCFNKDQVDRYHYSLFGFNEMVKQGTAYTRPDDPVNLFA